MVSTAVLLTAILASYALIAGAFCALTAQLGTRVEEQGRQLGALIDGVGSSLGDGFAWVDGRLDRVDENVPGLRAAVAGIDARLSTLEQRG